MQVFAEQYFSKHNFLNKKIIQDICSVRDSISNDKWEKLTLSDREKVKSRTFYQNIFLVKNKNWTWSR